jgi:UDP-2-acetamido-2,6-beta-L-arabino-hexul-4-ose reductase
LKKILVTGAGGFIGRNLCVALRRGGFDVSEFNRSHCASSLSKLTAPAELVFHLAGVNRPEDEKEFGGQCQFNAEL